MKVTYLPTAITRSGEEVYLPELLDGETGTFIDGVHTYTYTRSDNDLLWNEPDQSGPHSGISLDWFTSEKLEQKEYFYQVIIQ